MKKLSNTVAELKKSVTYKKAWIAFIDLLKQFKVILIKFKTVQ